MASALAPKLRRDPGNMALANLAGKADDFARERAAVVGFLIPQFFDRTVLDYVFVSHNGHCIMVAAKVIVSNYRYFLIRKRRKERIK